MATLAQSRQHKIAPEPRWPVWLALLTVCGLYLALPESLTLGPTWLLPIVIAALLAPTIVTHWQGLKRINRMLGFALIVSITLSLAWSMGALVVELPLHRQSATGLLRSAGALWACNILVFASGYWKLDAGGPHARDARGAHIHGAFLFPQMTLRQDGAAWRPGFVDYLFLAFNTSTAFSPTDVPPITRWAKLLMMSQSVISLGAVVILVGRAINML